LLTTTYGVDIMHVCVIILDIVNECNSSILGTGDPRKAEAAKELKGGFLHSVSGRSG